MDFVADEVTDGRQFRTLTILDLFTRECLDIAVGRGLTGQDVVHALERLRFDRAYRSGSTATTGASSSARPRTSGRIRTRSSSTSVVVANRPTTPRSNRSTDGFDRSVSTSTGFNPWRMPRRKSRRGDKTIMSIILTGLSRASAPMNTPVRGCWPLQIHPRTSGFRLVERIRQEPVPPLVIRLQQAYERLVHRRPRARLPSPEST